VSADPCPLCDSTDISDFEWTEETHPNCEWQWRCNACGNLFKDGDYERMVEGQRSIREEAAATPRMFPQGPDCPKCGAADAMPILFGLPTHEGMLEAYRGDAVLGGCCVDGSEPTHQCRACDHRFGADPRAER
jgi:hypothetical protein